MDFITLAEAAALTGKTLITIRRLAKKPSSAPYVQLKEGKLYIDKVFVAGKYDSLSTQTEQDMSTQHTQPEPQMSTQPEQDLSKQSTQNGHNMSTQSTQPEHDLSTQLLIDALREQYESRIQDLQKEVDRITTLFSQQQQIEMARIASLPAKSSTYEEAETVPTAPAPVAAESAPEPEVEEPKKRKWWQLF